MLSVLQNLASMQEFWWKLPFLRRASPMRRGAIQAAFGVAGIAIGVDLLFSFFSASPSAALAGDLAQIGATLLVAYGVEISWAVKASRARGADHKIWIGFVAALALCGLVGIGVALALSDPHGSLTTPERFLFSLSVGSIGLLGAVVALTPVIAYDWAHSLRAEYTDE